VPADEASTFTEAVDEDDSRGSMTLYQGEHFTDASYHGGSAGS
jgi:hypothetical protein